jgi:hypothetical protein
MPIITQSVCRRLIWQIWPYEFLLPGIWSIELSTKLFHVF